MKIISHRGLLNGPNPKLENKWDSILNAAYQGFSVEFDVWYDPAREGFFLGHDGPLGEQLTKKEFLEFDNHTDVDFFVHCKSIETLSWIQHIQPFSTLLHKKIYVFYHDVDDCVAIGPYTWIHPKAAKNLFGTDTNNITHMIYVLSNFGATNIDSVFPKNLKRCAGICTDYPLELSKWL